MAKRKRLTPAALTESTPSLASSAALETKAHYPLGVAPSGVTRAPIAQVAGDTAAHAALEELATALETARVSGRLVQDIALDDIKADHLLRDRMGVDTQEMDALKTSLLARGQQTPIEVIALEGGGYGLISGWRRLSAFAALHAETGESRFAKIQALIKPITSVTDSYVAMVEENEIRSNLSFYERARLASEAARLGVYPDSMEAVRALFASGSRARRSKINSFVRLHEGLGSQLSFPAHIPERLGLALVKALDADAGFAARVDDALQQAGSADPDAERAVLEQVLRKGGAAKPAKPAPVEVAPGVALSARSGRLVLSGRGVTDALEQDLIRWLGTR
ncbi:ParB family chromosome partitioning protein [Litoreibacter meonggei]|uniref:ParB family chromosome partitioning protein n=1 Tax=Litoreibacter meonggei TaxID=1049199 RepID=A0A497UZB7_9RHOB|nr:ParB N-terminal domain-containing protein [Litoreibacter meonggei]RLJ36182.1 ParB family chromosome partitioning protein [Litoreibacter meonggei]